MRIVLDTNVLVSGLLNPDGYPGRIVDLILAGEVTLLVDDRILGEYRAVLPRPKFRFDPADVEEILDFLGAQGWPVAAAPIPVDLPDPADLAFLEVAAAGRAETLVTGNARHFRSTGLRLPFRIESPAEFVRRFSEGRAALSD